MILKHNGNFETKRGNYGAEFTLDDGTEANVVTVFTGPGIAADTEIEADRPLTPEEVEELLDADSSLDHNKGPEIPYKRRKLRQRI